MILRTSFGRASASSQPEGPPCEWVMRIESPMWSRRAVPAFWKRVCERVVEDRKGTLLA